CRSRDSAVDFISSPQKPKPSSRSWFPSCGAMWLNGFVSRQVLPSPRPLSCIHLGRRAVGPKNQSEFELRNVMFASGDSPSAEWPGTHTSQLEREVHVWPVELRAPHDVIDQARSLLSEAEKERAAHLRTPQDRDEFVLSRSILRTLLSHFLNERPECLEITYSEHGKPQLADQSSRIRFNLCHSGRIAAYAVSMDCEVGIDVEQIRPVPEMEEIAKRFFSPAERHELGNITKVQK